MNYVRTFTIKNSKIHISIRTCPLSPLQTEGAYPHPLRMETTLENLPDGTVKVVVEGDGYREEGWVTSHHLVSTKERQLMQCIYQKAKADYLGREGIAVCDI